MKRSSFKCLASLACFTLGTGPLWGATEYYVRQGTEPGTPSGSCTCSHQPDNCCTVSTNTCCTLMTAMNAANSTSPSLIHITNNISTLVYELPDGSTALVAVLCQETGTMTLQSDVVSESYNGTIIDFNGAYSACVSDPVGPVLQPTYLNAGSPGAMTLMNVVFQNASASPGHNTINIAGGSLTINGTSLAPNDVSTAFNNNNWTVEVYNANQPSLTFGASGYYTQPFLDPVTFIADTTTLTMNNAYSGQVTLSGNIGPDTGITGSELAIYPTSGPVALSGILSMDTVSTFTGTVMLTGSSNIMTTLNAYGNVTLSQSGGVSPSTILNIGSASSSGSLTFASSFTLLSGQINLNATGAFSSSFNDSGNNVQINSIISGSGVYTKQGSGIQVLSNTSNSYTGGTNIAGGTLAISDILQINSGTGGITMTTGSLLSTAPTMTIASPISIATSGGLASTGTSLTVSSNISAVGAQLLIGSSAVSNATGTIYLTGSNNIDSVVVGALDGANNSYPATLTVGSTSQLGGAVNGVTLQGGGSFAPSASFDTSGIPLYIGTGSGTVSLSGFTLTLSGPISTAVGATGSPQLNVSGGSILLTGDNSLFTGNLVASNATVQVGNTSNLGSNSSSAQMSLSNSILEITGNVSTQRGLNLGGSNTIDIVGASTTATFTGSVVPQDSSSLIKSGAGTLSLLPTTAQTNTSYNLSVSAGNLIGNTYSLGSTTIDVTVLGSNVTFDQTSSGTFDGSISGAGSVSVQGTGALTFTPSASTYSGGTAINGTMLISQDVLGTSSSAISGNGGTLQTLSSFSMSHPVSLIGNFTFSVNSGTVLGLSETISGSGSLTKEGLGSLLLSGGSTYTGNTYVNQGALVVAGDISSSGDLVVASKSIVSGTGSIGNTDVFGTLAGGSSQNVVGTLNVVGDLTLEEGSSFGTVLTPGHSSLVSVSGPVTIPQNMTYIIAPSPGAYQAFSTVVLRGSSITGEFSNINVFGMAANFLSSSIQYTGTEVILDGTARSITPLVTGQNAINVADALDEVIHYNRTNITYTIGPGTITPSSTPELVPILLSLLYVKTPEGMTYALNQMHPAQMKGMAIAQENNVLMVRGALSQRMQNELDISNCHLPDNYDVQEKDCCGENRKIMTAWVRGNGESLFQQNEYNSWGPLTGYRVNTGVITAGMDAMFARYFYAGALAGYSHSHLHWKSGKGTGDISSGYAGIYFSALGKLFYGNASVIGSWNHYSADRHIEYGIIDKIAKNGHGGDQLLSHLDTGLNLHWHGLTIRPFDGFDYITQTERGYQEYNAGAWDLAVRKNNSIMLRNELGLQFAKCYCYLKAKWTLAPKFSWVREVRVKDPNFIVSFAEAGPSFLTHGYFPSRSLLSTGMTVTALMLQDTLKFDLSYNGEFKGRYASSNYGGQVRYSF